LVLTRKSNGLSVRSYQDRMLFWCDAAGIEPASPHWLRHTRAMRIMRSSKAKDPRGIAKAVLGHSSISSTGVYTGPSKEDISDALHAIDGGRAPRRSVKARYTEQVGA